MVKMMKRMNFLHYPCHLHLHVRKDMSAKMSVTTLSTRIKCEKRSEEVHKITVHHIGTTIHHMIHIVMEMHVPHNMEEEVHGPTVTAEASRMSFQM